MLDAALWYAADDTLLSDPSELFGAASTLILMDSIESVQVVTEAERREIVEAGPDASGEARAAQGPGLVGAAGRPHAGGMTSPLPWRAVNAPLPQREVLVAFSLTLFSLLALHLLLGRHLGQLLPAAPAALGVSLWRARLVGLYRSLSGGRFDLRLLGALALAGLPDVLIGVLLGLLLGR